MTDLMSIFQIASHECKDWPAPNLTLKEDGIWVERPSDTPEAIRNALTIEEFNALFEHPTGDYTVPVLAIPCSPEEFIHFMCTQEIFEFGEFDKHKLKNIAKDNQNVMMTSLINSLRITLANKIKSHFTGNQRDESDNKVSIKTRQETQIIATLKNLGHIPVKLPKNNGKRGVKNEVWMQIKTTFIGNKNSFDRRWKTMRNEGILSDE
ncbi:MULTISPECIES: hypothetical protein [Enterobacterales]|uniref:hypothetical protein n=1 Tax=Enterobacterales TaxID=91347 RepID=UPI002EDB6CBE